MKVAAVMLMKNIGRGTNYFVICLFLGASLEGVAAETCVRNVMALKYFLLISLLASGYGDMEDGMHKIKDGNSSEDYDLDSLLFGVDNNKITEMLPIGTQS